MTRSKMITQRVVGALAGLLLFVACSGGRQSTVVVNERDGEELVSLMKSVQSAIKNEDSALFESLFANAPDAKPIWKGLMNRKFNGSEYEVLQVTTGPEIERVTTNIHVDRLIVHQWFELDRGYKTHNAVFHTVWSFARGDSAWKLSGLRVDESTGAYGQLISEFNRMDHFSFEQLAMDWEEYGDPSPVVLRAMRAIGNDDLNTLSACTVDGAFLRAFEKGIEMPTLANGAGPSGRSNRHGCEEYLADQIKHFKDASGLLNMTVDDLIPHVTAYRITSMPRHCTKIKMTIGFGGDSAKADVASFDVYWTAAYIMQKWLAEGVGVETVRGWG